MKMSELINELSGRIKIYGYDTKIVLKDKKDRNNYDNIKEISDVFFDVANKEFVILFE